MTTTFIKTSLGVVGPLDGLTDGYSEGEILGLSDGLLVGIIVGLHVVGFLAGNVVFCRVFPSLHLQTWRVVSATCLWSCRRHKKMLCRPGGQNDTTFDDMSRHVFKCLQ